MGDVATCAKRDLAVGEMLDGEGGDTVFGKLFPARDSLARRTLPIGLTSRAKMVRPVAKDQLLGYEDVELPPNNPLATLRQELEETTRNELQ